VLHGIRFTGEGLGLASDPDRGVGEGELEFAAVFAKKERQVLAVKKAKAGREEFPDRGE
jgi:hypothetical protein